MTVSPEVLSTLLETAIGFAKEMLAKRNDFYPCGASLDSKQQIGQNAAYDGHEYPNPLDLYELLQKGFAEGVKTGKYVAVALTANVNIPAECTPAFPDGIRVLLESDSFSRFVYIPYRLGQASFASKMLRKPRSVEYGEPFSVDIPHVFFPKAENGT